MRFALVHQFLLYSLRERSILGIYAYGTYNSFDIQSRTHFRSDKTFRRRSVSDRGGSEKSPGEVVPTTEREERPE
jgi:hypothetical protein